MDLLWARKKLQSDPAWTDTDTLRPDILVPELLPTLSGMLKIRPYRPSLVASVQDYQRTDPTTSPTMLGTRVDDTLRR